MLHVAEISSTSLHGFLSPNSMLGRTSAGEGRDNGRDIISSLIPQEWPNEQLRK